MLAASVLALILAAAVAHDLHTRRIPNALILAGWGMAFGWHLLSAPGAWSFDPVEPGALGLGGSLAGAAALMLAFLPFYVFRIMGAGDVKLMSVVGAFFGVSPDAWVQLPGVALTVLVCGGLLSACRMFVSRNRAQVVANLRLIGTGMIGRLSGLPAPAFDARTDSADRMPYAIAIALGTVVYVGGKWAGLITVM